MRSASLIPHVVGGSTVTSKIKSISSNRWGLLLMHTKAILNWAYLSNFVLIFNTRVLKLEDDRITGEFL